MPASPDLKVAVQPVGVPDVRVGPLVRMALLAPLTTNPPPVAVSPGLQLFEIVSAVLPVVDWTVIEPNAPVAPVPTPS